MMCALPQTPAVKGAVILATLNEVVGMKDLRSISDLTLLSNVFAPMKRINRLYPESEFTEL